MKNKPDKEILDTMSGNPSNWKGILYFNKKDPRLLVQKQSPMLGWTFNFANPLSYLAIAGVILIIVIVTVIAG